ncbi:MAG: Coenzyme F420 hydrogenase/dehydrogenase, beta subunit C-terminal domain [Paludibacteraceae bacterium]|nr:Coenzyme F420 hydrogenase/dehydrogenase, beta subunit C-terminal domain [Paludibacteraceae bacterium]
MKENNQIQLATPDFCTGCAACANVCTKGAIAMIEGEMGHLYPHINKDLCVECGACEQHCSVLHPIELNPIKKAYAAWAKDETEYKTSVSGGVASLLSRLIIQQGGVVYGCAMLPGIEIRHIRVDNEEDLLKLKGSKYVQSSISDILPILKKDLQSNRKVLFIGTPCQVAAVKKLYSDKYPNLYLVDLICHGVPSVQILRKHILNVVSTNEIYQYISFRSQEGYCIVVGDKYKKGCQTNIFKGDKYIESFIEGYTYRESCYNCQFAQPNRVGDITIGDFWGLGTEGDTENINEHPLGCSVVLPITEKGLNLVNDITPNLYLYERSVSEAVHGNTQLMHPTRKTNRIRLFRYLYNRSNSLDWYLWCNLDRPLWILGKKITRKINKLWHKK